MAQSSLFFTDGGARIKAAMQATGEPMKPLTKWILSFDDRHRSALEVCEVRLYPATVPFQMSCPRCETALINRLSSAGTSSAQTTSPTFTPRTSTSSSLPRDPVLRPSWERPSTGTIRHSTTSLISPLACCPRVRSSRTRTWRMPSGRI
jgi:hypothetical protein